MDEAVPMAALTLIGLYCLVRAVLAWPANMLTSLAPVGLVVVGCVGFLVWACIWAGRSKRTLRVHIAAGGSPQEAINHELGHAMVGLAEGGRLIGAQVNPDGSGWCDVQLPCSNDVASYIAVSLGGAYGEGVSIHSPQCSGDSKHIEQYLATVPADRHGAVMNDARGRARSGVGRLFPPGQIAAMKRALQKTGKY